MKKVLVLFLSLVISISALGIGACGTPSEDKDDKCTVCVEIGTEVVYKERGGVMYIGYPCLKCGYVDTVLDSFEVDFVVTEEQTGNEVTRLQQINPEGDLVFCLKKGFYDKIFIGDKNRTVYLVGETGTQVKSIQLNGDAKGTTVDNIIFDSSNGVGASEIKFETASGNAYWLDTVIKNCSFNGYAYINSAWKRGVVDNLTVENCTFNNIGAGWSEENKNWSNISALFIGEVWGETIIKDCVFDGVDYAAIRFGQYSLDGDFLIENCFFRDIRRSRPIELYPNSALAKDPNVWEVTITLTIDGCTFADGSENMFRFSGSSNEKLTTILTIGKNTWANIPLMSKVSAGRGDDPTYYDIREQEIYDGDVK